MVSRLPHETFTQGLTTQHLNVGCVRGDQLEGSEQERSLDFSAIFESVHMPKFNYFWTLSKMAKKSRDRSCSEPSNFALPPLPHEPKCHRKTKETSAVLLVTHVREPCSDSQKKSTCTMVDHCVTLDNWQVYQTPSMTCSKQLMRFPKFLKSANFKC